MKYLLYIICLLFSFIYSYFNYGFNINAFLVFFLITLFSYYILKNNKYKFNLKRFLFSILLTFICIIYIPNSFLYGYKNEKIIIKNNDINDVKLSLYLNDKKQVISDNNDEIFTDYNTTNKLTNKYYYTINSNKEYEFSSNYNKKIRILFEKDENEKNIMINGTYISIPKREYNDNNIFGDYNKRYYTYEYDNVDTFNIYLSVVSMLYMVTMIYVLLINFNLKKVFVFLGLLSIEYSMVINLTLIYKITIFFLLFLFSLFIDKKFKKFNLKDILIIICSFCTTFCLTGNIIINKFSFDILFFEINFLIMNYIVLYFFFHKFKFNYKKSESYNNWHKYIIFIIVFLSLILIKYFIGDCFVHPDGTMQLKIITETKVFDDWHPFMHTLWIKLFNTIFHSNSGLIYIRIFSISFLLSWILDFLYKKGLKIKICYLITFLFIINPVNIVYIMTLVKDVDYVIVLVAVTFYLIKFYDSKELFYKHKLNIILFSFLLVLLIFFRHNGLFISIIILASLFVSFIKDKRIGHIIISILIISSLLGTREYLRYKLDVYKTPENFTITTMLHGLDYLYVNDKLDDNDSSYLESIMEKSLWQVGYDKYNIDRLIFYNDGSLFYKELDINKIMNLYMKNVFRHPLLLTKDRLYGTNILWNVFGSDDISTYKYHLIYDEYGNDWASSYNLKRNDNIVTRVLHRSLLFLGNNKITDAVFYRAGIYTLILLILFFYLIYLEKAKYLLILLPCVINNITLLLTIHHQSYRYVMHMPFIIMMVVLYLVTKKDVTIKNNDII